MKHASILAVSLGLALGISAPTFAQYPSVQRAQAQEQIYGYDLMTPQERNEYRERMRALNTEQEREAFRLEHHRKMQGRARAQGKTLPDTPPAGRGPGMMGPGGGGMMGPGYGR